MGRKPKVKTEKFDEKKMETAYDFGNITVPTKWDEVTLQMLSDYLALSKEMTVQETKDGIGEDAVSVVVSNAVVYLPLEDLVDREKELERLTKEQDRLGKEIARCEGMLKNPNFVNKAPEAKVNAEKEKLEKYKEMLEKVNSQLAQLK